MKLSWSKINTASSPMPFGLDISDFYIRAVQLKKERGKYFSLRTFRELSLPPGIIKEGVITESNKLSQLIKKLTSEHSGEAFNYKINCKEVITALPEPKTFIKMVTFQWPQPDNKIEEKNKKKNDLKTKEEALYKILGKELAEDVPLSLEEASFDYHVVKGNLKKIQPGQKMQLLVGIAPKKITEDYTKILEDSGLVPVALEIEGLAIARAIIKNKPKNKALLPETIKIIVDLGATRTGLIIYHNNLVRYSLNIPVSGRLITQMITEKEKISFAEAEKLKLSYHLNSEMDQNVAQIVNPALENIINRIKEAMIFCQLKISSKETPKIILCGGGANWPGLKNLLSQRLETDISIANPWINFAKTPKEFPPEKSLSFTTALGLALGGLYDYS